MAGITIELNKHQFYGVTLMKIKTLTADQELTGTPTQIGLLAFTMKPNKVYTVKADIRATGDFASVSFVGPADMKANGIVTNGRNGYLRVSQAKAASGLINDEVGSDFLASDVDGLPVYADLVVSSATGGTFGVKAEMYDDDSTVVAGSSLLYEQCKAV